MYIEENKIISKKGKIYKSILLRESYRENGKVKKRTIANLSNRPPQEIEAIKLALKYSDNLSVLGSLNESIQLQEGPSVGAVWAVYKVAEFLGIKKALGNSSSGKLALWQVIARVIDQGSRLSAVRLAQTHAGCEILNIRESFDENSLYDNLAWLADNQDKIEQRLFSARRGLDKAELFLYDVTSSYLEGEKNALAAYGYNRDKKKGKKQIVIGLLCDEGGDPVSCKVYNGNTQDTETFYDQVKKVAEGFGCKRVTFVGDRGMIKSAQIEALPEGFHYITAITKSQIKSLINQKIIQLGLFDESICEIENENIRYILRCNPYRAKEIQQNRLSKQKSIEKLVKEKNEYLSEHKRASVVKAVEKVREKIKHLKADKWLKVEVQDRRLKIKVDDTAFNQESLLDGCYVIKTDLPPQVADKQMVHDRYKDLALVEEAFRTCKTQHLQVRPVYVRTSKSTQGHVLVVMLAYMIIRFLRQAWSQFDLTPEGGLNQLATLCSIEMKVKNQKPCLRIPRPREMSQHLLKALNLRLPSVLPRLQVSVTPRKKLTSQRKNIKNNNIF